MQDQRIPSPAQDDARIDSAILSLLLEPGAERPWSVDVAREIGDALAVEDAVARLYGAGLVQRSDGYVWASRAALRVAQIDL